MASCLAAASAGYANPRGCPGHAGPSNLDLMVLASIADSPHLLVMADYLSTTMPLGTPGSLDRSADTQ